MGLTNEKSFPGATRNAAGRVSCGALAAALSLATFVPARAGAEQSPPAVDEQAQPSPDEHPVSSLDDEQPTSW
ncbi:MAG: hypothetical protein R6V07_07795 [Armatimonadota bacterium]